MKISEFINKVAFENVLCFRRMNADIYTLNTYLHHGANPIIKVKSGSAKQTRLHKSYKAFLTRSQSLGQLAPQRIAVPLS